MSREDMSLLEEDTTEGMLLFTESVIRRVSPLLQGDLMFPSVEVTGDSGCIPMEEYAYKFYFSRKIDRWYTRFLKVAKIIDATWKRVIHLQGVEDE